MSNSKGKISSTATYYVDEAGDGVIFSSKGEVLVGRTAPRYFILGMVHSNSDEAIEQVMTKLRLGILSSPLYKGIPSLDPKAVKLPDTFMQKMTILKYAPKYLRN